MKEYIEILGKLTQAPLNIYHLNNLQYSYTPQIITKAFSHQIEHLLNIDEYYYHFVDKFKLYWYRLSLNDDNVLIIGPIMTSKPGQEELSKICAGLHGEDAADLQNYLLQLPIFDDDKIYSLIELVYLHLAAAKPNLKFLINANIENINNMEDNQVESTYEARDYRKAFDEYEYETQLYQIIKNGDEAAFLNFIDSMPGIKTELTGSSSLRQTKNLFITNNVLLTRAAIEGGVPPILAYQLSDTYIAKMEQMEDVATIDRLQVTMTWDYMRKVKTSKIPENITPLIRDSCLYISENINGPLSLQDISTHLNVSKEYLSRQFKREIGMNITDYINKTKMDEACRLLKHTDKQLIEISAYLGYSTQSYFQNLFKKRFGVTPAEYRKR